MTTIFPDGREAERCPFSGFVVKTIWQPEGALVACPRCNQVYAVSKITESGTTRIPDHYIRPDLI